jgi:hypothetical protein
MRTIMSLLDFINWSENSEGIENGTIGNAAVFPTFSRNNRLDILGLFIIIYL